jgi:hypothetical protein
MFAGKTVPTKRRRRTAGTSEAESKEEGQGAKVKGTIKKLKSKEATGIKVGVGGMKLGRGGVQVRGGHKGVGRTSGRLMRGGGAEAIVVGKGKGSGRSVRVRKAGIERRGGKRGVEKEAVEVLGGVVEEELAVIALQEAEEEDAEVALAVRCFAAHARSHPTPHKANTCARLYIQ